MEHTGKHETAIRTLLALMLLLIPFCMEAQKNITFKGDRITLKSAFSTIEQQTGMSVDYDGKIIDVGKTIDTKNIKGTVDNVLTEILKGTGYTHVINGSHIIINIVTVNTKRKKSSGNNGKKISGVVKDANGEPIVGATVTGHGTSIRTVTDVDGHYTINLPRNVNSVEISYIGFETQNTTIGNQNNITTTMTEDTNGLSEIVVVGFGTQKKESVIGAIQQVKVSELKLPTSNLTNNFAGRIAGIISVQKTGEPGADGSNFWIRGVGTFASGSAQAPLILIDGTESSSYDLNALAPEVIESFSVLKDATATALYGSRGANGVLLITTKSGARNEKAVINIRLEQRFSRPTQIPELADGVTYMKMFNEAIQNRTPGVPNQFSDDQIAGTIANKNPYLYPNNNWYDIIFKNLTSNQAGNINVSGGGKNMDYFVSATFNNDMGLIKEIKENPLKNNIQNIRYSFQANVNTNLTKTTKFGVKLNVQIQDYTGPSSSVSSIFERVMQAQPTYFPVKFPQQTGTSYIAWGNKSGGPQKNRFANPYAELASGIEEMFRITTMATVTLDQKLNMLTKGLSLNAMFSLKHFSSTTINRTYVPHYFEINPNTLSQNESGEYDYELRPINTDGSEALSFNRNYSGDRLFNFNVILNYSRLFAEKHDVNAQFIYLQRGVYSSYPSSYNASLGVLNQGVAGRLTYDYAKRYFVEFNFGYNGSDNFSKGKRFGFFPSVALGYLISNEKFFEPLLGTISMLKIRGSYGTVGNSNSDVRFPGYTNVNMSGAGYGFGENFVQTEKGAIITNYGNENATWEVAKKGNIGIELGLFDHKLKLIADLYHEKRNNIMLQRRTLPSTLGIGTATPVANVGKVTNKGVDITLEYNNAIRKDFIISAKGNFTYAINKIEDRDEPFYQYDYQYERGGSLNRIGPAYVSLGLFADEDDIANSPSQASIMPNIRPGDIKYKDLNGDNVINEYDKTYVGKPTIPQIVYGFGFSIQYKRFDFSSFFQGVAQESIYLNSIHPFGVYHQNVLKFVANDYWSETNPNPNARYPRLSHNVDYENTQQTSTYWLRNGSFLRLKNMEVGYTFKFFRAYVSATNLLTFTPFKYWDPEIGSGGSGNGLVYPLQKVINIGLQFNL